MSTHTHETPGDTYYAYTIRCWKQGLQPRRFEQWLAFEIALEHTRKPGWYPPRFEEQEAG